MTVRLGAGPPATPADREAAKQLHSVVKEELPRVRAAALAWRNGVAGLLVGLLGFSLIRGRNDISQLESPYGPIVGGLLAIALISGTVAAFLLLRAAHGRPASVTLTRAEGGEARRPLIGLDHAETLAAVGALRIGLSLSVLCGVLLCGAVATTWYGPVATQKLRLEVLIPGGVVCGDVGRLAESHLTLESEHGEIEVDLSTALGIRPVARCPQP
jgi:hypothetical protein